MACKVICVWNKESGGVYNVVWIECEDQFSAR
jgi:hypothetical protein